MSLDAAAKRALFDALDPPLPRALRARGLDLEQAEIAEMDAAAERLPGRARSARPGGLVHIEQSGRSPASHRAGEAVSGGPDHSLFAGKQLRGRWIHQSAYQPLRNAAWAVRRSRVGGANNPLALQLACVEVVRLVEAGEQLFDVMEAFAELLVHP